jgi:hypothetical protein
MRLLDWIRYDGEWAPRQRPTVGRRSNATNRRRCGREWAIPRRDVHLPSRVATLRTYLSRRRCARPKRSCSASITKYPNGVKRRMLAVPLDLSSMMPERLAGLDALVERSQEVLDAASLRARAMLQTGEEFGWEFVSLGPLPEGIASAGLFVLPARSRPTPHRHPNSTQHMRRLSGEARVGLTFGDEVMDRLVGADARWVVIQADATHEIDVGDQEFVVISFHTVPQEELLEVTETGQRHY